MSFEVFVQRFEDGKFAGILLRHIGDAFGSFLTEGGDFDWQFHYGEADNCDVMLTLARQTGCVVFAFFTTGGA